MRDAHAETSHGLVHLSAQLACRALIPSEAKMHAILYSDGMETLPLSEARSALSTLVERVDSTHERVTITRNGHPAAVLISPDDLEALEETLDVLSDPVTMQALRDGEAAAAVGEVLDEAELRTLVAERAP